MPFTSYKKVQKTNARIHRERSQPQDRRHLGILPKKKDFKIKAQDEHMKRDTLKFLKKKALERNPDEFFFGMVNSKVMDGVHRELPAAEKRKYDPLVQEKEAKSSVRRDLTFLRHRLTLEKNRIERLKLHLAAPNDANSLLDKEDSIVTSKKHVLFIDSTEDKQRLAKLLGNDRHIVPSTSKQPAVEQDVSGVEAVYEEALHQKQLYREIQERIKHRDKIISRIQMLEEKNLINNLKPNEKMIEKDGRMIRPFRRK